MSVWGRTRPLPTKVQENRAISLIEILVVGPVSLFVVALKVLFVHLEVINLVRKSRLAEIRHADLFELFLGKSRTHNY